MNSANRAMAIFFLCVSVACTSTEDPSPASSSSEAPASEGSPAIVFNRSQPGEDLAVFTIDIDGSHERLIHEIEDAAILSPDGNTFLDGVVAADGRIAPARFGANGTGYSVMSIADPALSVGDYRWSPDGTRIVAQGWDDADPSRAGLYSFRSADGRDLVRLTESGDPHDWPIGYSSTGSRFLFTREVKPYDHSGPMTVYAMRSDGTGLVRLNPPGTTGGLTSAPIISSAGWSPDGRQVTFVASSGSFWEDQRAVFVVDAKGKDPRRITPWGETLEAVWSPDGRWIAFDMSDHEGPHDLFVIHPDGTGLAQVTSSDEDGLFSFGPVWSPDGSRLLFVRGVDEFDDTDLWIVGVDGTRLTQLTHSPGGYGGYAFLPSSS
jgi:Tol biopolymer transport system component